MRHPFDATFPFGRPSTERPPRRPRGTAAALVLGVYPSALHVQWTCEDAAVGALAVDVEPTVFWDGREANARIAEWKKAVGFRPEWGSVTNGGNGTSGDRLTAGILSPVALDPDDVWFTDLVPWFFIKQRKSPSQRRQQAEAIREEYTPFARKHGLPEATLPLRPKADELCAYAIANRRAVLRREILESETRVLITLGEEPRQVVEQIADGVRGRVRTPLSADMRDYEHAGSLALDGREIEWWALKHPGQRNTEWMALHQRWIDARTAGREARSALDARK